MSTKATIAIEFSPTAGEDRLRLELDDERNGDASNFAPGTDVWIRAMTDTSVPVKGATRGTVSTDKTRLRFEHEEELAFVDEDHVELHYWPMRFLSAEWLGRSLGHVTVQGNVARVAAKGYGILKIRYEVAYAALKLSGVAEGGPVLVWAEDAEGRKGNLQIDFEGAEAGTEDVYILAKNYCTGLPIANAQVWVDGIYKGETDTFGRLHVGRYQRGTRHSLKLAASGFKDSDMDALANDEFTLS